MEMEMTIACLGDGLFRRCTVGVRIRIRSVRNKDAGADAEQTLEAGWCRGRTRRQQGPGSDTDDHAHLADKHMRAYNG